MLYLLYQRNKTTKTFKTIWWSHHNNGKKYDCDKRFQNFLFQFWFAKRCWWESQVWNWIDHKKEWVFSRDYKKKQLEQLLLKYKHRDNVHKHRK